MASDPFSVAQELAEVKAAKELAHEYGWAEDSKEYMSMLSSIRKKHKGLMKMSKMTADTFVSISLAIMEMYLTLGYVSFFTVHI